MQREYDSVLVALESFWILESSTCKLRDRHGVNLNCLNYGCQCLQSFIVQVPTENFNGLINCCLVSLQIVDNSLGMVVQDSIMRRQVITAKAFKVRLRIEFSRGRFNLTFHQELV